MEKKSVKKVRWYLRYQSAIGMVALTNANGVRYWDSFAAMANDLAARIDANPDKPFQFVKEFYYVKEA